MANIYKTGADKEVLDLVWDNTTDAIFTIGKDGSIQNVNPSFESMLGFGVDELKELDTPPYLFDLTKQEYEAFLMRLRSGENFPYELKKLIDKDGKILEVLASYRAVNNKQILAIGMYKDFTEQMVIQQKLEDNERLYRKLIEHLPEAIIKQRNGKIEFINAAGLRLFNKMRLEEVIGLNVWDLASSEQEDCIQQILNTIYTRDDWQKPITIEESLTLHNEREIYAEIRIIPIGTKENPDIQLAIRDVTEKKEYEAKLEYMAYHDPLTGLKNRRLFSDLVTDSLNEAKSNNEKIAILYIDLDEFKLINDNYGHDVGDHLLQQFSKRLRSLVRNNDILSRVGGDEFLVLLQGIKNESHVKKITHRMHAAFQERYEINGEKIKITTSIGIAIFPENGIKGKTLIYHADQALYRAKLERNKYLFY